MKCPGSFHIENNHIVRQISLNKRRYTLGREAANDIVFGASKVSRFHATLVSTGREYTIIDNNSANHVYVNDERVLRPRKLISGDVVNLSRQVNLLYFEENSRDEKMNSMLSMIYESINNEDFLRLKEITGRVTSLDSLNSILEIILQEVTHLVGAERGFIALTDSHGNLREESAIRHNIPETGEHLFSASVVRQAIVTRKKVFLRVTSDSQAISQSVVDLELRSVMCAPLTYGGRLYGVLYVDADKVLREFSPMDQLFFTLLSDHAVIAIESSTRRARGESNLQQREIAARESEERYRQLVQLSPDGVVVETEGLVSFANTTAATLFGVEEANALIGLPISDLVPDGCQHVFSRQLDSLDLELQNDECDFRRLDGTHFAASMRSAHFTYEGKSSTLLIVRDVSERQRMEQEILRTQKLESLGVLAGGIAHDFNNILSAILGNLSLAQTFEASSELRECLRDAEQATNRAQDLTQQLLTFSKGGAPIRKTSSIAELIQDTARFALRGSNVRCTFDIDPRAVAR